jgi:hypothetical protein
MSLRAILYYHQKILSGEVADSLNIRGMSIDMHRDNSFGLFSHQSWQ